MAIVTLPCALTLTCLDRYGDEHYISDLADLADPVLMLVFDHAVSAGT